MKTRRFGRTELQVSELVFGGGFVGGLLIHQDDDTKLAAVKRALSAGINLIDTAPSYGDGKSEQALGWILPEVAHKPYLATKFRLNTNDLSDIAGQIEKSITQSLSRLQRDSIDLLQLHNSLDTKIGERAITPDIVLRDGGVADCLDKLREQGLFKYTGITALGSAECCKQVVASERFDSAQVYYNLLNPVPVKRCQRAGQSLILVT